MKMAVVGCEASGKTVFMCAMADYYGRDAANNPNRLKLTPENAAANGFERYQFRQMRSLHQWPHATPPDRTIEIKWSLRKDGDSVADVDMIEFGGETFRAAFRGTNEGEEQDAAVKELLAYLGKTDYFVVLVSIKALLADPAGESEEDFDRETEALWVTRGILEFISKNRPDAGVVIGLTQADKFRNEIGEAGGARNFFASRWPTVASAAKDIPVVEVASVSKTDEYGNPSSDYHTRGILPVMYEVSKHCFGNKMALENGGKSISVTRKPLLVGLGFVLAALVGAAAYVFAPAASKSSAVLSEDSCEARPAAAVKTVTVPVTNTVEKIVEKIVRKEVTNTVEKTVVETVTNEVPVYLEKTVTNEVPVVETVVETVVHTVTNEVPVIVEKPITNYVEMTVIETVTNEVPVVVEVEKEVTNVVERIVEKLVEKVVQKEVTNTVEKTVVETVTNEVPVIVEVEKEITNVVEKTLVMTVTNEVPLLIEKLVTNEVPVVIEKTITNEVPVIVERKVTKEVPVVVEKTVTNEIPVYIEMTITNEVPVVVEKEVTNVVERIVEQVVEREVPVTVEKIVEKVVTNEVPVTVEKVIERVIEKEVPVTVEKIVTNTVERIVERAAQPQQATVPTKIEIPQAAAPALEQSVAAEAELATQIPDGFRIWTDYNGRKIIAKWVGVAVDNSGITIMNRYGRRIDAVLWKFSTDDQNFIKGEIKAHAEKGEIMTDGRWVLNPMIRGK